MRSRKLGRTCIKLKAWLWHCLKKVELLQGIAICKRARELTKLELGCIATSSWLVVTHKIMLSQNTTISKSLTLIHKTVQRKVVIRF